jgi:hypothetical protein
MSRDIAQAIAADRLKELRKIPYAKLEKLVGHVSGSSTNGPDGEEYQVETEILWDGRKGGNIRVIVAVDGGGVSGFKPLTEDFIISAEGAFIGEDAD